MQPTWVERERKLLSAGECQRGILSAQNTLLVSAQSWYLGPWYRKDNDTLIAISRSHASMSLSWRPHAHPRRMRASRRAEARATRRFLMSHGAPPGGATLYHAPTWVPLCPWGQHSLFFLIFTAVPYSTMSDILVQGASRAATTNEPKTRLRRGGGRRHKTTLHTPTQCHTAQETGQCITKSLLCAGLGRCGSGCAALADAAERLSPPPSIAPLRCRPTTAPLASNFRRPNFPSAASCAS